MKRWIQQKSGVCSYLFLAVLTAIPVAEAQEVLQGEVDYPYLGIRLTIPAGWLGQEDGDFLVLGSNTEPGLMGLTVNEATATSELKAVADRGWIEDGVNMTRSGEFDQIGSEGMGAEFSGVFQGAKARAFIAGVINPFGNSVSIIALTSEDAYGSRQVELVKEIADSLQFALPREAEHNADWRASLPGHKLTAMSSSYSSGPSYYDVGGQAYGSYSSYSSRTDIHLCGNGQFFISGSSSSSFDSVGGFGTLQSGGDYRGNWKIGTGAEGESLLLLNYDDGDVRERVLDHRDGKTYLDGERYFYTDSDAC